MMREKLAPISVVAKNLLACLSNLEMVLLEFSFPSGPESFSWPKEMRPVSMPEKKAARTKKTKIIIKAINHIF
jgi:hypothetical protein